MEKQFAAVLEEWCFVRESTKAFLRDLDDGDLDRLLPRKGLDTIRKHLREMLELQKDWVTAIDTHVMRFNDIPDSQVDDSQSSAELLADMQEIDAAMERARSDTVVEWFGQKKLLSYHMAGLIAHEAMHVGQIIAFCYALDMKIPEQVRKHWALSG